MFTPKAWFLGAAVLGLALTGGACSSGTSGVGANVPAAVTAEPSVPTSPTGRIVLKPQNPPKELTAISDPSTYTFTNASAAWGDVSWLATFPTSGMKGTNLSGAVVGTYVAQGTCASAQQKLAGIFKTAPSAIAESLEDNARNWQASQWSGAAAGTMVETLIYSLQDEGRCYRVALDLWSTNLAHYDASVRPKMFNPSHYIDVLKEVVMNTRAL